ncbi:MAG: ATP-binding protein [Planctomycetia bacterium]|nr:ATP-binding protein [Planctomycetia bacterium]
MSDTSRTWIREDVFPSVYGEGADLVESILQTMKERLWPERDIFAVNLAIVEAITNAIEHGNHCNAGKSVTVECRVSNDLVHISVRDEGLGFAKDKIPDPRNDDNIECPTGRGVLLIYGFMTKVWYNDQGNQFFMEKVRSEDLP